MMEEALPHITGPMGGIMAMMFIIGCGAGYGFAIRTALRDALVQLDEARKELAEAKRQIAHWQELYLDELKHRRGQ